MAHAVYPFPGMNPYLEHPMIWKGFRFRLVVAIADQIQPLLDSRYIASIETRKFSEVDAAGRKRQCRQHFVEILDVNQDMDAICIIEIVDMPNKRIGPARRSYIKKPNFDSFRPVLFD